MLGIRRAGRGIGRPWTAVRGDGSDGFHDRVPHTKQNAPLESSHVSWLDAVRHSPPSLVCWFGVFVVQVTIPPPPCLFSSSHLLPMYFPGNLDPRAHPNLSPVWPSARLQLPGVEASSLPGHRNNPTYAYVFNIYLVSARWSPPSHPPTPPQSQPAEPTILPLMTLINVEAYTFFISSLTAPLPALGFSARGIGNCCPFILHRLASDARHDFQTLARQQEGCGQLPDCA